MIIGHAWVDFWSAHFLWKVMPCISAQNVNIIDIISSLDPFVITLPLDMYRALRCEFIAYPIDRRCNLLTPDEFEISWMGLTIHIRHR